MKFDVKTIHEYIKILSDLKLQRKIWLNENNNLGYTTSYEEFMCMLYDNYLFEEFVLNELNRNNIAPQLKTLFSCLLSNLNNYNLEKEKEILEDLEWKKITRTAKKIVKLLNIK